MAIEIVEYRNQWAADFQMLAERLRAALGERAVRIDHIGSTSVPGLASKDRIDIQVTVADFEPVALAPLAALGYTLVPQIVSDHRPPGDVSEEGQWEKRYFRAPAEQRPTNLHIRAAGRANQRYALLFRDYLRTQPRASAAYAELKRRLAQNLGENSDSYPDVKDPVCDLIIIAAEAWAMQTDWRPGPSDS